MYRFLIVIILNTSLMSAMFTTYLPRPPFYTHRTIPKTEAAAVFKIISEQYLYLNFKDFKYHIGRHGWNNNLYIDFISNNNGKMVYSFDYNSDTKELTKKDF